MLCDIPVTPEAEFQISVLSNTPVKVAFGGSFGVLACANNPELVGERSAGEASTSLSALILKDTDGNEYGEGVSRLGHLGKVRNHLIGI